MIGTKSVRGGGGGGGGGGWVTIKNDVYIDIAIPSLSITASTGLRVILTSRPGDLSSVALNDSTGSSIKSSMMVTVVQLLNWHRSKFKMKLVNDS